MSDRIRPFWPAYPLTVLVVGLGHASLGQWRRRLTWFALYVLALAFLSARTVSGALDLGDPFVFTALQFEAVSYTDVAVPLSLIAVALFDPSMLGIADGASTGPTATDARSDDPGPRPRAKTVFSSRYTVQLWQLLRRGCSTVASRSARS